MAIGTTNIGATPCCGLIIRTWECTPDENGAWHTPGGAYAPEFEEEAEKLNQGICPDCGSDLTQDPWFVENAARTKDGWRWDYNAALMEFDMRQKGAIYVVLQVEQDYDSFQIRSVRTHRDPKWVKRVEKAMDHTTNDFIMVYRATPLPDTHDPEPSQFSAGQEFKLESPKLGENWVTLPDGRRYQLRHSWSGEIWAIVQALREVWANEKLTLVPSWKVVAKHTQVIVNDL